MSITFYPETDPNAPSVILLNQRDVMAARAEARAVWAFHSDNCRCFSCN